jgi:hypothetical protein
MIRKLAIVAALVWMVSATGRSQDSPSLGDVARQLRAQKSATQHKSVITNDDLSSHAASGVLGLGEPGQASSGSSPQTALAHWESFVNKVDATDRSTLVKLALQGSDADFPGRQAWEDRLITAKNIYVSQGRELIEKARQLTASAQALQNSHAKPDDPQVRELTDRLKELVRQSVRSDANFQAIVLEGRDLAHQAPAR